MLTGENKDIIIRILYGMKIDINSPDGADYMDENEDLEDDG